MTHSESDVELLEAHLDGSLDARAAGELQGRLATDQALSSALVLLRSQRAVRLAAFQSMEPDAATAERLLWRVRGAMHDQKEIKFVPAWGQWRVARLGSAAAACLVLGFFVGRIGHGGAAVPNAVPTGIASNGTGTSLVEMKQDTQTNPQSQFVAVNHAPQISVPVTNEYGQVVAWQTFDNSEQAKNFTEDLHRARGGAVAPAASGQTKLVDQEQVPF